MDSPSGSNFCDMECSNLSTNKEFALRSLDEVYEKGTIDGHKLAKLKLAYEKLDDRLQKSKEEENVLLLNAKTATSALQAQNEVLKKGDDFLNSDDNEVKKFRTDLLNHSNETLASEDRLAELEYKIDRLQEEKKLLEREVSNIPSHDSQEKNLKDLQKQNEEIKWEITQRNQEKKSLRDEIDRRAVLLSTLSTEMEQLEAKEINLKDSLVKIINEPSHIAKQTDIVSKQNREASKRKEQLISTIEELNKKIADIQSLKLAKEEENTNQLQMLSSKKEIIQQKEKEADRLSKEVDLMKERQNASLSDRTSLDVNLKHVAIEKKTEHETHARKQREKDRQARSYKKVCLQLKVAEENCAHVTGIHSNIKSNVDHLPKDNSALLQRREDLYREVDSAKRSLAQQNALTSHERQHVEFSQQEEERLMNLQAQLRVDVGDLTRLAQIKADEREQKARDYLKAELRLQRVKEDVKAKDLSIQDSSKKLSEVQHRLSEFAKMYEVIKNERNKCVTSIQASSQKVAEMREKIRIYQNEIEILRTSSASKERLLQKAKLKHANAIVVRDSNRNEASKQHLIADALKERRDQQNMTIARLVDMINRVEEQTIALRRRYETVLEERNSRGLTLIERNEEVCLFYERVNVQDSVIRNGDLEFQNREEELRFLQIEVSDLKRAVDLLRQSEPNKRNLDREYVTTQIQLSQCRDLVCDLEKALESPGNTNRLRMLSGKDPNAKELLRKQQKLEERLAAKEAQSLEKDLILEEITRLMNDTNENANDNKSETISAATKINDIQSKIKDVTRKMMALVSELSLQQATALKLQQEVHEKEIMLKQCYIRMERGEPPSEQIEQQWQQMLREAVTRRNLLYDKQKREDEMECYKLPGGTTTTAEPRPNAYIPNNEADLPVPRPYGSNAPFKPTEPGANMRHFRKPVIKPIEI